MSSCGFERLGSSATSDWCPVTIIATIANNRERFDTRVARCLIRPSKLGRVLQRGRRRKRVTMVIQNRRPWIGAVIQDGWARGRWTLHDAGRVKLIKGRKVPVSSALYNAMSHCGRTAFLSVYSIRRSTEQAKIRFLLALICTKKSLNCVSTNGNNRGA